MLYLLSTPQSAPRANISDDEFEVAVIAPARSSSPSTPRGILPTKVKFFEPVVLSFCGLILFCHDDDNLLRLLKFISS